MAGKNVDAEPEVVISASPAMQVADGSVLTVTVTAIQNGLVMPNAELKLEVGGGACFSDTQAATSEGTTGADGRGEGFRGRVAESGYVAVTLDSDTRQSFADSPYSFTSAALDFSFPKPREDNAFADGGTRVETGIFVWKGDRVYVPDEPVLFTLGGQAQFARSPRRLAPMTAIIIGGLSQTRGHQGASPILPTHVSPASVSPRGLYSQPTQPA